MGARHKLNSLNFLLIVGAAVFVGLIFQSPLIVIALGAVLIWSALDNGAIRLDSRRR